MVKLSLNASNLELFWFQLTQTGQHVFLDVGQRFNTLAHRNAPTLISCSCVATHLWVGQFKRVYAKEKYGFNNFDAGASRISKRHTRMGLRVKADPSTLKRSGLCKSTPLDGKKTGLHPDATRCCKIGLRRTVEWRHTPAKGYLTLQTTLDSTVQFIMFVEHT